MTRTACFRALLCASLCAAAAAAAWPAAHYVRSGASGLATGMNWRDAWTDLPAVFVRGDVYYVAAGIYGRHVLNTPTSGSTYIFIRKATVGDHGTASGWVDAYGAGQAVFQTASGVLFSVETDYWDIDGAVGSGPGGQGIKLLTSSRVESEPCVYIPFGRTGSFVSFRHVEFQGPPPLNSNPTLLFFANGINTNNLTFQYNYFHDTGKCWMSFNQNNQNVVIEHCYFRNAGSGDPALHSAGITVFARINLNFHIRYNVFENMVGTANTTYIEPQGPGGGGIYVYGNVFRASSTEEFVSQGILSYTSSDYGSNIRVYNNTIYGLRGFYPGVHLTAGCTDVLVIDNIWQDCAVTPGFSTFPAGNTAAWNILNTGEVRFVDPGNGNFNLASPTASGYAIGPPVDRDFNGNVRGADGSWDVGAFEYSRNGPTAPPPPTRLRVGE